VANDAKTNDAGLILNGIEFSPQAATIIYWCFAAVCAAFSALGVFMLAAAFSPRRRLTLTATEVSVPIGRRFLVVPLSDIEGFDVQNLEKERALNIYHARGKLAILRSFLPDAAAFDEVCSAIASLKPSVKN
jgi:hypothetical protein